MSLARPVPAGLSFNNNNKRKHTSTGDDVSTTGKASGCPNTVQASSFAAQHTDPLDRLIQGLVDKGTAVPPPTALAHMRNICLTAVSDYKLAHATLEKAATVHYKYAAASSTGTFVSSVLSHMKLPPHQTLQGVPDIMGDEREVATSVGQNNAKAFGNCPKTYCEIFGLPLKGTGRALFIRKAFARLHGIAPFGIAIIFAGFPSLWPYRRGEIILFGTGMAAMYRIPCASRPARCASLRALPAAPARPPAAPACPPAAPACPLAAAAPPDHPAHRFPPAARRALPTAAARPLLPPARPPACLLLLLRPPTLHPLAACAGTDTASIPPPLPLSPLPRPSCPPRSLCAPAPPQLAALPPLPQLPPQLPALLPTALAARTGAAAASSASTPAPAIPRSLPPQLPALPPSMPAACFDVAAGIRARSLRVSSPPFHPRSRCSYQPALAACLEA
ncbi:hypothetical protein B0H10DRAFT_2212743 [Mycena sp. CBHHK59/15]|nr:hypothetical protein B0H10DRAFT_2212743 [Mycena sp. CBHHK59/15]